MLSMHLGYLATEPSVLNDGRVTVNKFARDSGLKSQSASNTGSMRFVSVVHDYKVRFDPGQRSLFLMPISSANTTEERSLLAGKCPPEFIFFFVLLESC